MQPTLRHLPTHLALLNRELAAWARCPTLYFFCGVFGSLSAVCMFWLSGFIESDEASLDYSFFRWHPWLFAVTAPMVGFRSWSEESKCGMFETLGALPIRWESIVLAKAWAGVGVVALALAATLPCAWTAAWLGSPDIGMVLSGYAGSLLCGAAFALISQAVCVSMRCSTASLVCSAALCLSLTLSGLPKVADGIRGAFPGWEWAAGLLSAVSILPKFQAFMDGRIEWAALAGFAWLIGCSLLAAHRTLLNARAAGARL